MYQFGLAVTTPEISRMSGSLGANQWASRVVVVLQLAAWTAVGIVLLQKGVTSLQKTANDRNLTQFNYTETVSNLVMKKIIDDGSASVEEVEQEEEEEEEEGGGGRRPKIDTDMRWADLSSENNKNSMDPNLNLPPRLTANDLFGVSRPRKVEKVTVLNTGKNLYEDLSPRVLKGEEDQDSLSSEEEEKNEDEDGGEELPPRLTSLAPLPTAPPNLSFIGPARVEIIDETPEVRQNLRTPSNRQAGGTAAAAVAMVAVGAVMLVLGPAVIILRALDERRQERRFLKLSGQDDLPPSYEQATLMDEAPRYSTLSLNTIMGNPTSPGEATTSASDRRCDRDPSEVQEV